MIKVDGYDEAIVGVVDNRYVYSKERMIEMYMKENNCGSYDAIEWHCYNTFTTHLGELTPLFAYTDPFNIKMAEEEFEDVEG